MKVTAKRLMIVLQAIHPETEIFIDVDYANDRVKLYYLDATKNPIIIAQW